MSSNNRFCLLTQQPFVVSEWEQKFLAKMAPSFRGKKFDIPLPSLCPEERMRRRTSWQNERNLYHRKCDATGKDLISNFHADVVFPVYEKGYWFSDKWNTLSYGRDFDFSKTFFENFKLLRDTVPRFAIQQQEPMENCNFCNFASNCKDCYLIFDSDFCRDCYYSDVIKHSQDCLDCSFTSGGELCYETIHCMNCYNLRYSENCQTCMDSFFLKNCIGCKNCAFSMNLRNKQYYFANESLSKEAYEAKMAEYKLGTYSGVQKLTKDFEGFTKKFPNKYMEGTQNDHATGDYIYNSKNVLQSFNIEECFDVAYCENLFRAKDCMDVSSFGENTEMIYDSATVGLDTQNVCFSFGTATNCSNLYYCDIAYSSKNCFGCVSLNRNEYCILNKQYSKEEYEDLLVRIVEHMKESGEWGEFFPIHVSPFAYNETIAMEYFPLTKEEVLVRGWKWREADQSAKYIGAGYHIPDDIREVQASVTAEIHHCEITGKAYKIIPQEFKLYTSLRIPLPRRCPAQRHIDRVRKRHPRKLWERQCMKCGEGIKTSFAPESTELVYCEKCYLESVF